MRLAHDIFLLNTAQKPHGGSSTGFPPLRSGQSRVSLHAAFLAIHKNNFQTNLIIILSLPELSL